jgi:hypothetical protein
MKRFAFPVFAILCLSIVFPIAVHGQDHYKGCPFSLDGTWQSSTDGQTNSTRARFSNGVMTELSRNTSGQGSEWQATSKSTYRLDDPKKPKAMILTKVEKGAGLSVGTTLDVKAFDDGMFVTSAAGEKAGAVTRWTRIDPDRYFLVLAAGKGDAFLGGPAFAELIRTDGVHTQTDAVGTWPVHRQFDSYPMMGVISDDLLKHFENEPINDEEYMFRLELPAGPYNRALEVLKSWRRRAEEGNMLYAVVYENNEVFLNQLVSSLNQADELAWNQGTPCGDTIKLYKLTWLLNDMVVARHSMSQVPYYFFKKLRELNSSLHLSDSQFRAAMAGDGSGPVAVNQSSAR